MGELITGLLAGFSAATAIGIIFYLNPDKFDKWVSIFLRLLSFVTSKFNRHQIKREIQSNINGYVKKLAEASDMEPIGVKIKWAGRDGDSEVSWDNNEVVLVIRDRGQQQRNFVHAAYLFTSTTLLRDVKKHLSKKQTQSIDLFTTGKIIEAENKAALDYFIADIFDPLLQDEKINEMVEQFRDIDTAGFYSNILLRELSYLGHKVIFSKDRTAVYEEVHNLIVFLRNFSIREVGDMSTADEFVGKFLRSSIKIVSMAATREKDNTTSPSDRVCRAFEKGVENVYVIGPHPEGKEFMEKVCGIVLNKHDHVRAISKKSFGGVITKSGSSKSVKTYLIHLNSSMHRTLINTEESFNRIKEYEQEALGSINETLQTEPVTED